MKIHKEGRSIIINQFILLFIVGIISNFNSNFITYTLPIFLFLILFSVYFFRVPKRKFLLKTEKYYHPVMVKL